MKKSVLFILALFLIGIMNMDAQVRIKKVGIELGIDQDMIQGLNGNGLLDKTNDDFRSRISDSTLDNQFKYSGVCENPNIRLNVVLEPFFSPKVEIQTSLLVIWNRWDGMSYYNDNARDYSNVNVDLFGKEIGVEGALVRRLDVVKWLHLYGGGGVNTGVHFDNWLYATGYSQTSGEGTDLGRDLGETLFGTDEPENYWEQFEDVEEDYFEDERKVSNGISARAFAQAGFGISMWKKIEFGATYRFGYGIRTFNNAPNDMTNLRSFSMHLRYVLN
ncbi:MAG: hypothetical protein ACPG5P_08040 [Saprospiraceae bacterium]